MLLRAVAVAMVINGNGGGGGGGGGRRCCVVVFIAAVVQVVALLLTDRLSYQIPSTWTAARAPTTSAHRTRD